MSDMKVYLAGYIHDAKIEECIAWRRKIRDYYDNWKGKERYPITWLDPLNGKDLTTIRDSGLNCSFPSNAMIHRDFKCVADSDLLIANLDTFGESRPPVGTICECAWAWQMRKPLVLITDERYYIDHPFMTYFASWIVKDVNELIERKIINYFFKGTVSAQY